MDRDELLALEDDELLRHCRCDTFRASGPGGQHRNTSDSAVRLTLEDTEVSAIASEERSQHRNRARAVKRLRLQIALNLRRDPAPSWDGPWKPGARDRQYAVFVAHVFDTLAATEYRVSDTAKLLEAVPSADPRQRQERPLRTGEIPSPVWPAGTGPEVVTMGEVEPGHLVAEE